MSEHFSTSGPICPYCEHEETPDDPTYYDEMATEFECSQCEKSYEVSIYIQTGWTTSAKDAPND